MFFGFSEYLSMASGIVPTGETHSVQITIPISTSSGQQRACFLPPCSLFRIVAHSSSVAGVGENMPGSREAFCMLHYGGAALADTHMTPIAYIYQYISVCVFK